MQKNLSDLLAKLIAEKDKWIVWMVISIASGVGFYFSHNLWFLIITTAATSFIALNIIRAIYRKCCLYISKIRLGWKNKRIAQKAEIKRQETQEKSRIEHETLVWKIVEHANKKHIENLCNLLHYEMFDDNKLIRYVPFYGDDYSQRCELSSLQNSIRYFHQICNNGRRSGLLLEERMLEGVYITIEPYFFVLLENYDRTKSWERV